jgi:folate-dependent phosphoribosylglycinamide formyltransferase PurN
VEKDVWNVHQAVVENKELETGITVHYVNEITMKAQLSLNNVLH